MASKSSMTNLESDDELPMTSMEPLGHGREGKVEKVEITATFANKTWRESNDVAMKKRLEEIALVKRLESRSHIIRIFATFRKGMELSALMSPVADNDLRNILAEDVVKRRKVISDRQLTRALGCLQTALAFIHEANIFHGDINPSNILIHQGEFTITDFGCAKDLSGLDHTSVVDTIQGTHSYFAPEMCTYQHHGPSCDVFALGCVLMEVWSVLQGHTYSVHNPASFLSLAPYYERLDSVHEWIEQWRNQLQGNIDQLWLAACSEMMQKDSRSRHTMLELTQALSAPNIGEGVARAIFCQDCVQIRAKEGQDHHATAKFNLLNVLGPSKKEFFATRDSRTTNTTKNPSLQEDASNTFANDSNYRTNVSSFRFMVENV